MVRRVTSASILRRLAVVGIGLLVALALVTALGAGYESLARHRILRENPPRGKMVDIGGRRIHLDCRGTGSPTVVFESGLDTYGSLSWSAVHDAVAQFTRACAYDRAGIMWSDPSSGAGDADTIAADLHQCLQAAQEHGPYVMIGHSMGGPYIMTFTRLYGSEVAGLVLVDASHPDQAKVLQAAGHPPFKARSVEGKLLGSLGWAGLTRILWSADDDDADPKAPEQIRDVAPQFGPASLQAMTEEEDEMQRSLKEAGTFRALGDRPLAVLTHGAPYTDAELQMIHISKEQGPRLAAAWDYLQNDEATWSTQSTHQRVADATHYIQFDRPDVVIAAIRDVTDRSGIK